MHSYNTMMISHLLPAALLLLVCVAYALASKSQLRTASGAESPLVVGILAQPLPHEDNLYIAASYVKWLEAGGARSIPIPSDEKDPAVLDEIYSQINALFLPGGASELPYAVEYLVRKAMDNNQQRGDYYFPIWGTCLGFEFLASIVGGDAALTGGYRAENRSWALQDVVRSSELYGDPETYEIVTTHNTTLNNHQFGLHPETYWSNEGLQRIWRITSVNHDDAGTPFVSTLEPHEDSPWPFYAVQYHPEKNAFEYATYPHTNIPYEAIDHSTKGVAFSMTLARFAVGLAQTNQERCSAHHAYTLPDKYPFVFTYPQRVGTKFEQIYLIPSSTPKPAVPQADWTTATG